MAQARIACAAAHVDDAGRRAAGTQDLQGRVAEELGFLAGHERAALDDELHVHEALASGEIGERRVHCRSIFLTLPVSVFGRLGTVTMYLGTMKFSSRRRHSFCSPLSGMRKPFSSTT